MKCKTKYLGNSLRLLLVLSFQVSALKADMAYGKMAAPPMQNTELKLVDENFLTIARTRALTEQEKDLQSLSKFSQALGLKNVKTYRPNETANLTSWTFTKSLMSWISTSDLWEKKLPDQGLKQMNAEAGQARKVFGEDSYVSALIHFQNGESKIAQDMLVNLFEASSKKILTSSEQNFMYSPFEEINSYRDALSKLGAIKEVERMDSQLQKLKIHYSNLPNSNIKT